MSNEFIKKLIIQVIKDDGNRRIPPGIIVRKIVDRNANVPKIKIFNTISEMLKSGELKEFSDKKVVLDYIDAPVDLSKTYEGVITINSQKDGFIKQFDDEGNLIEEFYVNKIHVNSALRGDIVKFALLKKDNIQTLREASVIEIIKRNKQKLVAEVIFENDQVIVIPDDNRFYLDIIINNIEIAHNNDKVILRIDRFETNKIFATIIKIIGNKNSVGTDIESVVYDNGAEINFSEEAIAQSEELDFKITEFDKKYRKDLRDKKIITIDPATSKDLDDAVYVKKLSNGNYKLFVCIADVSHYVRINTPLDNDALNLGTSIYLVDRVIPMLPNNISDFLCSLNQGEEKFTLTSEIEVNSNGDIVDYDVYPSIMKNYRRFSYDEVNSYIENKNTFSNEDKEIVKMLDEALELHSILRENKRRNGYVEFDIKEPKIILDEKGIPISITLKQSGIAQKMIEDFMVCANESVTLFAKKHNLDFIYRIHDKPETKKIDVFKIEAKKLGFYAEIEYAKLKSKDFLELINKNKDHQSFYLFNKLLLKTMQKAKYSLSNIGHFGLAIQNYTHFTSPIRRYPDLIVHRLFWMYVFAKDFYTDEQRRLLNENFPNIIEQCNFSEIRQLACERDVNSMKFAEYMSYRLGEIYKGTISTVTSFGFFVELENTIEGLVSLKSLDDDFYVYNPETITLIGQRKNKIYTLGQKVTVQVVSASKNDKKIDFRIINSN